MPYKLSKKGNKFCVLRSDTGESKGCSDTRDKAVAHLKALYSAEAAAEVTEFDLLTPIGPDADLDDQDDDDDLSDSDVEFLKAVQGHQNSILPLATQVLSTTKNGDVVEYAQECITYLVERIPVLTNWIQQGNTSGQYDLDEDENATGSDLDFAKATAITPSDADNPIAAAHPEYDKPAFSLTERKWAGPIAFEGTTTGDNRSFVPEAITWDTPPLPFSWQEKSGEGHGGSIVIGRVDKIWRDGQALMAEGVVLEGIPEADKYLALMHHGAAGGVSVDGDSAKYEVQQTEKDGRPSINFNSMRIRGLTAVAIPAFNEAHVEMDDFTSKQLAEFTAFRKKHQPSNSRGVLFEYAEEAGITASAAPVKPPSEWFHNPEFSEPTPITITDDGLVYGHIALWSTCHIGMPSCTRPPRGGSYKYFHTGEVETDDGLRVPVGHMTFNTGHASIYDNPAKAAAHYDHTGAVGADVVAGEDRHGVWVSGALRPQLSEEEVRTFRAAPPSGDWRRIGHAMELVAVLSVNTPGFPVPRNKALVAAGTLEPDTIIFSEPAEEFEDLKERQEFRTFLADRVFGLFKDKNKDEEDQNDNLDEGDDSDEDE